MSPNPIYLDHNSTTPVDPRVLKEMIPYFAETYGNAASRHHTYGWEAKEAVETARRLCAAEIGARTREIIFTSGATESINLAIKGFCENNQESGNHIITQVTEHKAVLDTCRSLVKKGWKITYLPVNEDGRIDPELVSKSIRKDTVLVVLMQVNNEIGVIQPIMEVGRICHARKIFFMVDAAQSYGKLPIDVKQGNIDLLAASGHKIYGPKGIGLLYVRLRDPTVRLKSQIDGGGHERGIRSGTLAVPLIVGLGKAVEICASERVEEENRIGKLNDRLLTGFQDEIGNIVVNGSLEYRLSNNLNVSFLGVDGEVLMMDLKGIACSTGSACSSATLESSHVIRALSGDEDRNRSSVRFGIGRFNTEEDIDIAIKEVGKAVRKIRGR